MRRVPTTAPSRAEIRAQLTSDASLRPCAMRSVIFKELVSITFENLFSGQEPCSIEHGSGRVASSHLAEAGHWGRRGGTASGA